MGFAIMVVILKYVIMVKSEYITEIQPQNFNYQIALNLSQGYESFAGILLSSNYYYKLGCCDVFNGTTTLRNKPCVTGNNGIVVSYYDVNCVGLPYGAVTIAIYSMIYQYYVNNNLGLTFKFTCDENYSIDLPTNFGPILLDNVGVINALDLNDTGALIDINVFPTNSFYYTHFPRLVALSSVSFSSKPILNSYSTPPTTSIIDTVTNYGSSSLTFQKTITTTETYTYLFSQTTQTSSTSTTTNSITNSLTNTLSNTIANQQGSSSSQSLSISNALKVSAPFVDDTLTVSGTFSGSQSQLNTETSMNGGSSGSTTTNGSSQSNTFLNSSAFSNTISSVLTTQELYSFSIVPSKTLTLTQSVVTLYDILDFSTASFNVTACFPLENSCSTYEIFCPFVVQSAITTSTLIFQTN
jgi:hypothetical protein